MKLMSSCILDWVGWQINIVLIYTNYNEAEGSGDLFVCGCDCMPVHIKLEGS